MAMTGIRNEHGHGQVLRYLLVGAWNTLFGYAAYAVLTYLLTPLIPYAYMVATVLSTVLAVTNAYIGYKLFVFKTRGNYLREYLRFYVVYGASGLVNLALLPLLVPLCERLIGNHQWAISVAGRIFILSHNSAPYLAALLLLPVVTAASYFGHRDFSFRRECEGRREDE